jgi:hypothetical protein
MVSWLPKFIADENVLASFVHEAGHGGSFESPSALGHGSNNFPLNTLGLAPIASS